MMSKKISLNTAVTLIILAVALAISVTMMVATRHFNRQVNAVTQKQALYSHITDIDTKVRTYYDAIDEKQLRSALAAGYVNGLSDPYARYLSTNAYQQALLLRQGQASGVGLTLRVYADRIFVDAVDNGSAAQQAGLKAGDMLLSFNGETVASGDRARIQNTLDTAAEKLSLKVLRDGKEMAFEMIAYAYPVESVSEKMLNDTVGYIRITAFYDNTLSQFKAAYSSLENDGATTFIFDVRGCSSGGSRSTLEGILSFLMPHGVYAIFEGADGTTTNLVADSAHEISTTSVTLVNAETKGEAELFAAILQEFKCTTVMGEQTAGKGKIQDFVPLQTDNSALLLTVGEITLMQGGSIEGVGVKPDTTVEMSAEKTTQIGKMADTADTQLQAALAVFSSNMNAATITTTVAPTTLKTTTASKVVTTTAN